jgi:putative addiction module CopG family antidote
LPTDQTRNVSITAEMNAFIRSQVASSHYQNACEVVRAGLRLLMKRARPGETKTPPLPNELQTPRAAVRGRRARQV